jgi:hypothetical protein
MSLQLFRFFSRAALALGFAAAGAAWAAGPPPEGRCPDVGGGTGPSERADGGVPLLQEGDVLRLENLLALAQLFPDEVWSFREAFFYEGMRMEIGSCHRRFPVADFYREATDRFAAKVKLDEDGNIEDYVAGVPFPPEQIAADDPQAATKWAWNYAHRYRGAGPVGRFRILDLGAGNAPKILGYRLLGNAQTFEGEFFWVTTGHRADLVADGYRTPEAKGSLFVAGGRFFEPFNARHLAWRQIRPEETDRKWKHPDDTFVYVPEMRKPRRAASAWVDGLYMPRYTVTGESAGGPVPIGKGESGGIPQLDSIQPTAALNIQATENLRKGFVGLMLRPNAYDWKLLGQREVLAPLNATAEGWPTDPDRNYGPSGLSVASDRWDLRYAVVIEGIARRRTDEVAAVQIWIDWQTQQPLYFISKRDNGLLLDIGILVHRFSSDRAAYNDWPGGGRAHVFDPVAASFYYVPSQGSGWRRESYDIRSLPTDPDTLRKYTTTDTLTRQGR